jgi:cytochrome c-type biogenesis protein CcmH/NrfG
MSVSSRSILEPALAADPGYAPGWALLSDSYAFLPAYGGIAFEGSQEQARPLVRSVLDKAQSAAREAIRLDPKHAGGYAALGNVEALRKNWTGSEDLFNQAIKIDPNDTEILDRYSQVLLAGTGRLKEALPVREQIRMLEPFVPIYMTATADIMRTNGDPQAAIRLLEPISPEGPAGSTRTYYLAQAYAAAGRYNDAADTFLTLEPPNDEARRSVQEVARLLRSAPTKVDLSQNLTVADDRYFYSFVGAPELSLDFPERFVAIDFAFRPAMSFLWDPVNASLRKTERYRSLLQSAGLVSYWRARGWPEICRPLGTNDFVCE